MDGTENREQRQKQFDLSEFNNNITIITIGVLSLAYLNQLVYYSFFSIPIYNYIQVSELVTLFVPSLFNYFFQGVIPITILLIMFQMIKSTQKLNPKVEGKIYSNNGVSVYDILGIKSTFDEIVNMKNTFNDKSFTIPTIKIIIKQFFKVILYTIQTSVFTIFFLFPLLFLYGLFDDDKVLFSTDKSRDFSIGLGVVMLFSVVSISISLDYINYCILKFRDEKYKAFSRYLFFGLMPILFILLLNDTNANNIKKGFAEYDVAFIYNNKRVKTDTNFVYVGATQNYLFLRERMTRKNHIYKTDKIDNLEIKKISYTLSWVKWHK